VRVFEAKGKVELVGRKRRKRTFSPGNKERDADASVDEGRAAHGSPSASHHGAPREGKKSPTNYSKGKSEGGVLRKSEGWTSRSAFNAEGCRPIPENQNSKKKLTTCLGVGAERGVFEV